MNLKLFKCDEITYKKLKKPEFSYNTNINDLQRFPYYYVQKALIIIDLSTHFGKYLFV